jgi:glycosyltransferase involved in cell wall biosynthesis
VLYLSYDGMCDPLGRSQVLPYLFGLAARGHRISLISFEKKERSSGERAAVERACAAAEIEWRPLPYHKDPPVLSTIYDVRRMRRMAERLHRSEPFDLIHCRSDLPAIVGLAMKRRHGVPFIFDMRGFWADERLEGGGWSGRNPLFRAVYSFFKSREREFWRDADTIVSLTEEGRSVVDQANAALACKPPISVIPCCVDFELFTAASAASRTEARTELGIGSEDRVLAYIGSLGGNYMLDEMLDFFRVFRERHSSAKLLFITHANEAELRATAAAKSIPDAALIVRKASREEVPTLMAAADCGIAFKQPSFSAKACSPTKLSEMLAIEIPVIVNSGVGDVDAILRETGAGIVVNRFADEAYREALDQLAHFQPDMNRWRAASRNRFDLEKGIDRYDAIYNSLQQTGPVRGLAA